jgi:predicted nucleic acid-binding protein
LLNGIRHLPGHFFWHDDMSLFDAPHVRLQSIGAAGQVTNTYLLALAVRNGGRLATFDRRLSAMAVEGGAEALAFID